jgi:biotin carboxyl carrier protein
MKRLRITVEGKSYDVEVELLDDSAEPSANSSVGIQSSTSTAQSVTIKKSPPSVSAGDEGAIVSPLSAVVVSVDVAVGDTVKEGQKVITLEAMKMNTTVPATAAGIVEAIQVSAGDAVEEGQPLIKLR